MACAAGALRALRSRWNAPRPVARACPMGAPAATGLEDE